MAAFFPLVLTALPSQSARLEFLAVAPTPGQFWAVVVWGILPAAAGVWVVYRHQQMRMSRVQRRVRQLEARLATMEQALSAASAEMRPPSSRNPQSPSLTTRVRLYPAAGKGRGYTQPVPRAVS